VLRLRNDVARQVRALSLRSAEENMSANHAEAVHWDPYNPKYFRDPYATFRRLREEAPLYRNEEYDFYALTRYAEVERALKDTDALSSARGTILEIIKADAKMPESVFIFQDPPVHTAFRGLIQRVMTPKRMNALEAQVRQYCAQCLDPLVGGERFDFIADLGAKMPMRVISMLLGIPEADQDAVRKSGDDRLRTEAGKPMTFSVEENISGNAFGEYIEWRTTHPSDDMMTELLHADFTDATGKVRKLARDELLSIVDVIAGAGNETTNRLIGWAGKELAEHPDQRRDLVNNPALVPQAIEELLRYQTPGPAIARYVTKDVEFHGQTIPKGTAMMLLIGAANRDDRRFVDGDTFNIHRESRPHLGFGHGIHACVGAMLARVEGRVALQEVLKRFPEWHVDYDHAELASTSTVRGWETLPVFIGSDSRRVISTPARSEPPAAKLESASLEGTWNLVVKGPTGPQPTVLVIERAADKLTGTQSGQGSSTAVTDVTVDGNKVSWVNHVTKPIKLKVTFAGEISGNTMGGKCKAGFMGSYSFTAVKA
jgi:cytochrome P450